MQKYMLNGRKKVISAMAFLSTGMGAPSYATQQEKLDIFAETIGYNYTVIENRSGVACPNRDDCFVSRLDLKMPAQPLPGAWTLYFSFVERAKPEDNAFFTFKHINGDVFALTTKPGIHFVPGKTYPVTFLSGGHAYSDSFAMPNAFIVAAGLKAHTIAASRALVDPETGIEQLPFVTPMTDETRQAKSSVRDATRWSSPEFSFKRNAALTVQQAKPEFAIIPMPKEARHVSGAALNFNSGVTLKLIGADSSQLAPALAFLAAMGVPSFEHGPALHIEVSKTMSSLAEAYSIDATAEAGVHIRASDVAGAAYALRSLAQQVSYESGVVRPFSIEDAPRFSFRGLFIDVARNFHSKAEVLKLIEQMAVYKLNRLHLHMGDDEGWRLAIAGLPELTEVGAVRCYDLSETHCLLPQLGAGPDGTGSVNGFLSRQDYIDIVEAAEARQIEVIPSFDMPGHSRAAIRSMEARYHRLMASGQTKAAAEYRLVDPDDKTVYTSIQNYSDNTLNVCLPATYRFIDRVISSVADMHKAAGVPLKHYHIGADETAGAWVKSPVCQVFAKQHNIAKGKFAAYFITRVANNLAGRGIGAAGWSDGIIQIDAAKMSARLQANSWQRLFVEGIAEIHAQINQGLDVVLSTPDTTYFDMPYEPHPKEPGYDWASRGIDLDKVFGFMPQNLPANAVLIRDIEGHAVVTKDSVPITAGHSVVGMQAQLWSETVRSDSNVDYMIFPRIIALAERAWHQSAWEVPYQPGRGYTLNDGQVDMAAFSTDYQNFKDRLTVHVPWLDRAGVHYRIPPVGALIHDGVLEANLPYGAFVIEYRKGAGRWAEYTHSLPVATSMEIRARSIDGRVGRSSWVGR